MQKYIGDYRGYEIWAVNDGFKVYKDSVYCKHIKSDMRCVSLAKYEIDRMVENEEKRGNLN